MDPRILGQTRILVVGDVMLDRYWFGDAERISPEAPVPVVKISRKEERPGGAANVARNLRQFAEDVAVIGMTGQDHSGEQLRGLLAREKIDMSNAIEEGSFRTIVKTRIIAQHQQVVRVDREQGRMALPLQVVPFPAAQVFGASIE